jgi:hypothetical protein
MFHDPGILNVMSRFPDIQRDWSYGFVGIGLHHENKAALRREGTIVLVKMRSCWRPSSFCVIGWSIPTPSWEIQPRQRPLRDDTDT